MAETIEGAAVQIAVLANDTDDDGDPLIVAIEDDPANGEAITDGTVVTYTPNSDFSGSDSFIYSIDDNNGGTDTATVAIEVVAAPPVNQPPQALADVAETIEGAAVQIAVLANDTDDDGDLLTVAIEDDPTNGTASTDGTVVTYTPNSGFSGSDRFTYLINDGNGGCLLYTSPSPRD